jgi:hypothetical protein
MPLSQFWSAPIYCRRSSEAGGTVPGPKKPVASHTPNPMEPEHLRFGGGATETMLHPLVAVWLLIAIVLILTRPRGQALTVFCCLVFVSRLGKS